MRNDEFNHFEIKNNYSGFEYGKIPGLETSPFKGNPSLTSAPYIHVLDNDNLPVLYSLANIHL